MVSFIFFLQLTNAPVSNLVWMIQDVAKKYNIKFGSYILVSLAGIVMIFFPSTLIVDVEHQAVCVVRRLSEGVKEKSLLSAPAAGALQFKSGDSIHVETLMVRRINLCVYIILETNVASS